MTKDRILGYAKKVNHPTFSASLKYSDPNRPGSSTMQKKSLICSFVSAIGALDTISIDIHSELYHQRLNPIRDLLRRSEFTLTLSLANTSCDFTSFAQDRMTLAVDDNDNHGRYFEGS